MKQVLFNGTAAAGVSYYNGNKSGTGITGAQAAVIANPSVANVTVDVAIESIANQPADGEAATLQLLSFGANIGNTSGTPLHITGQGVTGSMLSIQAGDVGTVRTVHLYGDNGGAYGATGSAQVLSNPYFSAKIVGGATGTTVLTVTADVK